LDISDVANSTALSSLLAGVPVTGVATTGSATSSSSASGSSTPAVQAQNLLGSVDSALFSSLGGSGSTLPDLSAFAPTAQAYSLYTDPGLLQQLATGSRTSGSAPGAAGAAGTAPAGGAVAAPVTWAFNPFDEASWWTDPSTSLGTTVDATA
jgi:hypothetical protein